VDSYQALKTTDTWQPAKLQVAERDDLNALVARLYARVDQLEQRADALERRYVRLEEHVSVKREAVDGVGTVEISSHES
jgi:hypothetical protein